MRKFFLLTLISWMSAASVASAAGIVNTFCPVMREHKAKEDRAAEYQGKTYGFCCKSCIAKFKKDPEKYLAAQVSQKTNCHGDVCK